MISSIYAHCPRSPFPSPRQWKRNAGHCPVRYDHAWPSLGLPSDRDPAHKPMHAFLVTFGTDGDVFPYLGLSRELRRRGHRVTIISSESHETLAVQAADAFYSLASISEVEEVMSNPDMWHPLKGGILMARWGARLIERQYDLLRSVDITSSTSEIDAK